MKDMKIFASFERLAGDKGVAIVKVENDRYEISRPLASVMFTVYIRNREHPRRSLDARSAAAMVVTLVSALPDVDPVPIERPVAATVAAVKKLALDKGLAFGPEFVCDGSAFRIEKMRKRRADNSMTDSVSVSVYGNGALEMGIKILKALPRFE